MKVLLFDLGGVVINWTGLQEMQKHLGDHYSLEDIRRKMIANPTLKLHELGECSSEEFAESFIRDFNLPYDRQKFIDIYKSWGGFPYQGVVSRLQELRKEFKLVCLSNTNPVHWDHLLNAAGVGEMFDHCFASHLLRRAKPDPDAFHAVLNQIESLPSDVCFFDDAPENIEAAENLGMNVRLVDASVGVLPHLETMKYF